VKEDALVSRFSSRLVSLALFSSVLAACGGSDKPSSDGNGGGGSTPGLSLGTAPTATLPSSQDSAAALAAEVQSGAAEIVAAANRPTNLPAGVDTLPVGAVTTLQCSQLSAGGTGSYSIDSNLTGEPTAGSTITISYDACSFTASGITITYDGTITMTYTRYVSASDYAITYSASHFSYAATGSVSYAYGPLDYSFSFDYANGELSYTYYSSTGGAIAVTPGSVTTNGDDVTISSGTYVYTSAAGGGVVKVVYDHWTYDTTTLHPVSGSVTITGASGAQVAITASSTGYTVVYSDSTGTLGTFTVTY
jgi:hypothetical protein